MICPICENEPKNQQKCEICGWEFIYFTDELTAKELQEYNNILQNYRTEFYYTLAQQYFNNKQYEETIQCCFISCEKQMFENPLVLLGITYQHLGNNEEALKYALMSFEINPNNESTQQLLSELNSKEIEAKEIIKLTPEILEKNMFEKTEQHQERIKSLGYVEIGTVELENYDADSQKLKFKIEIDWDLKEIDFDNNLNGEIYEINITAINAKELYTNNDVKLIVKIEIIDNKIKFLDIKIDKYSFIKELTTYQNEIKKKIKQEKIQREERAKYENIKKNIPSTWIDQISGREWTIKKFAGTYSSDDVYYNSKQFTGWLLPTYSVFNELLENLNSNVLLEKVILEYILEDNKVYRILQDGKDQDPNQVPHTRFKPYDKQYETPWVDHSYMILYKKEQSFFNKFKLWS